MTVASAMRIGAKCTKSLFSHWRQTHRFAQITSSNCVQLCSVGGGAPQWEANKSNGSLTIRNAPHQERTSKKKEEIQQQQIERATKRRKNRYVYVNNALNTSHSNSILIVASITFELHILFCCMPTLLSLFSRSPFIIPYGRCHCRCCRRYHTIKLNQIIFYTDI